jgi:DNA-binding GntR family transcriptional regulator
MLLETSLAASATRRDAVVRQLREEIVSGVLGPGTVIKDAELAARLGLSITPVREALGQLAVEGLVEMPPNRAKRVAPLSRRGAVELCAVMRVLSLAAYEEGLPRLLFADLQAMRAAHAATLAALDRQDLAAARQASRTFHDVVIRAADNREMRRLLALVLGRFERLFRVLSDQGHFPDPIDSQAEIISAVERHDLAAALSAYRESLLRFEQMLEHLPEDV